ncbi:hypothetical protein P171DRAFT_428896 [Karstenula rhodostoma CBS 690.94]|uniref:Uncharacterized protein n=1 Tax=Karstenula rhodostoma CBS 690.94 TaxID=1392251 RepID=A0A9P4PRH0_9PLEO|nr:hypothetical protein P171DRAFT_428896 [Karstenula rhodostoma CBS 690.94]
MAQDAHGGPCLATLSNELLLEIATHLERDYQYTSPQSTSLKNLSLVNHHFRWLLRPLLMRSIVLAKPPSLAGQTSLRWQPSVRVWNQMREGIHFFSVDANMHSQIKKMQLEIPVYIDEAEKFRNSKTPTPKDEIVKFLTKLTSLEHLHLQTPPECNSSALDYARKPKYLARRVSVADPACRYYLDSLPLYARIMDDIIPPLCFANVTTLVVDQTMVFLLEHCPRVRHLGLFNSKDEYRSPFVGFGYYSKFAPHVTHVEARARWSSAEIPRLIRAWPNLQHLGVFPANDPEPLKLGTLLKDLARSSKRFKVLKLAGFCVDSFWASGPVRLSNLFLNTENVLAHWINLSEEIELPWETFSREHAGQKIMIDVMEMVFRSLGDLDECRIGDVAGARRVWDDHPSDYSGEFLRPHGDGHDGQPWTLRFNWLENAELRGPVKGKWDGDWLLRQI